MHKVHIKTIWSLVDAQGQEVPTRLLELLAQVHSHGSLSKACRETGASYRHAWSLVRQAERQLGHALLTMTRGKGSSLTALGDKLVWAGHRIQARVGPLLESLASELEAEIDRALSAEQELLRLHASHGFAVETLLNTLQAEGRNLEHKYMASQEALASWHAGHCELAGFHLPLGPFEARALADCARWFGPDSRIIHITQRRQGLLVARGNPLNIVDVGDLARPEVRYVNRQPGSGTRLLLSCLLEQAAVPVSKIKGFDLVEYTHAAVAAYVASGMADAGMGVEPPARRFGLDFIPLATERYFFVCREADLLKPALAHVLSLLRSDGFQAAVNALPGYRAVQCGEVQSVAQAFSSGTA